MAHIGNAPFGKTVRTVTSETLTSVKTAYYPTGGYIVGYVDVYVNGVRLTETADFTATDGTTVTLQYNPSIGDTVDVVTYGSIELANAVRRDGDTLVGTLYTRALVPTANITYDIGTSTMRYKDLYLSGNTINLGDVQLTTNGTAFSVSNTTGGTFPSALANTTITGTLFTNGAVTFANSTSNTVNFNTNGTVVIGSANAFSTGRPLQVGGVLAAGMANAYVVVELDPDPSVNTGFIGTRSNTAVAIKTNDSGKLYVMANGYVGIGNNTPGTKMHVAGSITLDNNQAIRTGDSASWMIGSTNTEITIGSQAAGQGRAIGLYSSSNSTPAIYCSNNGIVNMPKQPVFDAYRTGSFVTGTSVIAFNATNINVGSHYNTSTGYFTAPIAGNYHFFFNANIQGTTGSNIYISIRKNGAGFGGAYNTYPGSTSYWFNLAGAWNIALAVNDTVSITMQYADNRMDYWNEAAAHFGGHLIG
jgi:hypothetical protein